jgi:thiamine-monophosphate kinase
MVEGRHFERRWFPWRDLGEKVLAVNLSDLAAMGDVKPLAALVTAAFPGDTPVDNVDKFYKGLESCAQRWKTGLLGGDTVGSRKDWFISVTVFGEANPKGLIRRSGARVGDYLVTTGPLGLAGAGLEVLQQRKQKLAWTRPLIQAFSRRTPPMAWKLRSIY